MKNMVSKLVKLVGCFVLLLLLLFMLLVFVNKYAGFSVEEVGSKYSKLMEEDFVEGIKLEELKAL